MKKAFDQTVRDLKREVNKKVLKVPGIEQKILDATSNEPWGPHGSLLAEIAQATNNYHEYQMVMNVVWKRINDTGKNWRHVYKGLIVLDYLVAHGTERVIDDIREHSYQISALADFQYIDSSGRDQGSNVRRKSQSLVSLVNDKERIQEVRQKALATRDKYRTSGTHRSPGGYDNDRYEGSYGSRYDNRNGYGGEREYGYREDDRYGGAGNTPNREGDRYSRDSNERYGRDREDEYKGSHSNHEYAEGSGRRSYGRDRDSYGDDEAYSSRGRQSNGDGATQDERPIERKPSNQQIASPPPNYEDVTRDAQDNIHNERNGGTVPVPVAAQKVGAQKVSSPPVSTISVPPGQVNGVHDSTVEDVPAPPPAHAEANGFDEFDPRGSVQDTSAPVNPSPAVNSLEMDLFGSDPISSLALVSVPQPTTSPIVEPSANSGFETNGFMGMPPASTGFDESFDATNPFGDPTPFKVVHEETPAVSQTNAAPAGSFHATGPAADANPFEPASAASFGFGDTLGDLSFGSNAASGQQDIFAPTSLPSDVSPANPSMLPQQAPQPAAAGPPPATHVAATSFAPQAHQAGPSYPHTVTHASSTFPHSQPPHPAATNQSPIPQTVAAAFAPSQMLQPALNLPSGQLNFYAQPVPGTGIDGMSGAPQNGAPSYTPSQPSQFAAPTNLQPSQPAFPPQTATTAPQATSISQGASQPLAPPNSMPSGANFQLQSSSSAPPETIISALQFSQSEPVKKFEPKSTVWADTLSRGLVNLNISGPKANPHADIGVDFDSINRKEKRQEKKVSQAPVVSTINMGKAMGAGSGIGRAGASAMAPPANPMGAGRGVGMGIGPGSGYGGGMGMNRPTGMGMGMNQQQMGMGMGMGMNQQQMGMGMGMNQQPMGMGMGMNQQPMGMNMGMGMNQGMAMRPPMGMGPGGIPGAGYNPMGTGYGGQQPYGGYR
ncbi:clathrin interactor EPSIN 2 [Oryza brachyantha]|uniref:ENTH domain-containing protein n=1 Tax=Oryza brachyantha TaxID=4533 RepID=J3LI57_ORYBR|nr:clathrin interactor EPSIN 2 [Oryza brachyantha]